MDDGCGGGGGGDGRDIGAADWGLYERENARCDDELESEMSVLR